jgi:hypothetical protein
MIRYYSKKKYDFISTHDIIEVRCRWNGRWMMTIYCPPSENISHRTVISKIKNTKNDILITKSNYHSIVG